MEPNKILKGIKKQVHIIHKLLIDDVYTIYAY